MSGWRKRVAEKVRLLKERSPRYRRLCLAIKSNNRLCMRKQIGFDRCKFHGGLALSGAQNPAYKHGKYVKNKKNIIEQIEKLKKDPNLKDLTGELATLKVLLRKTIKSKDNLINERTQRQIAALIRDIAHVIDVTKRVNEGYTLNVKSVNTVIVQVVKVIQNRVKDPLIRRQIAGDIRSLSLMS